MSNKTLITVLVTVKKRSSEVAVECAEHEVPILRFMHGDDKIEIKERDYGTIEVPDSAEAELARLVSKYDDKTSRNVAGVYGDLDRLAKHVGLATSFDPLAVEHAGPEQSSQIDKGAEKRKAAAKDARAKKSAPKPPPAGAGGRQGSAAAK